MVNNFLKESNCISEHADRYYDVIGHKFREFDILANPQLLRILTVNGTLIFDKIDFAVECKNICEDCPLIVVVRKYEYEINIYVKLLRICSKIYSVQNLKLNYNIIRGVQYLSQDFIDYIGVEILQVQ